MNKKVTLLFLLAFTFNSILFAQKYGEDSVACIEQLSLYKINYRIWKDHNYSEEVINQIPIYTPWQWVFLNCPQSSQNIYVDGVKIIQYLYDRESDKTIKNGLIDTLMLIYDQRIQYFGQTNTSREGAVLGRKGVDLYKYRPNEIEEINDLLGRSIELEGNKSKGPVLVYYFRSTIKGATSGLIDSSAIIENYDIISEIIEYNLKLSKNNPRGLANWQNVKGNIETTFEPFATCKDLITIFKKKIDKNPEDTELLRKITGILNKKDCADSDLFFEATKKFHALDPTGESAYLMGIMHIKKEQYNTAAKYFEESVSLLTDKDKTADAYYLLANINLNTKNFNKARSFAYKGLEIRPEDGSFYLVIGDMYASSAKDCGQNDLTSKVAFWAAVDKYKQAKSVDAFMEDEANKRITAYSRQFPSVETIFFYDLSEGDAYRVECWINETTTVRSAK
ncbi:MAG: tetratricopeptide repeat protein [Bacteroidales bacterium]|nr:tetratricopeptide repeat protein [Bacteroidales bacterium]